MIIEVESRSARRTKNLFKEAFLSLVQNDSYAIITVKEIVNEADYNRSTFYKHYLDKEDLLDDLVHDIVDGLSLAVEKCFKNYTHTDIPSIRRQDMKLFDYIYENKRAFSLWKQSDLSYDLTQRCTEAIYQKLYHLWSERSPHDERMVEISSRVMSYQLMGIIYGWLLNGFQTEPKVLADEFIQFYKSQYANKN